MNKQQLIEQIFDLESFLCVGLDPVISKIPKRFLKMDDPVFEFNKMIIDATADLCVAYKPNTAFYEALGISGWKSLQKTLDYIPDSKFAIADAKRGDIGNTSTQYAEAFFKTMEFDALTIAPYMGIDSVSPFLEYKDKWVIVLALTSNKGSADFQQLSVGKYKVYEQVLETTASWGSPENTMFVVGATHPESFKSIRSIVPDHFLLVPGVGAQGGNLSEVAKYGMNEVCGLLVNSSRGIIYAGGESGNQDEVRSAAMKLRSEMKSILKQYS